MIHTFKAPPEEGHTYAWSIFTRPGQHFSPRHPLIPWSQYHLQHPRPHEQTLFDVERNEFDHCPRSRAKNNRSQFDKHGRRANLGRNNPNNSTQNGDRSYGPSVNHQRSFRDNRKFKYCRRPHPAYPWPSRMGEVYWDDHNINFHDNQNLTEISLQDTRKSQTNKNTLGILFDSRHGKFYLWNGTRMCRERGPQVPGVGSNGHNDSGSLRWTSTVSDDIGETESKEIEYGVRNIRLSSESGDNSLGYSEQGTVKKVPKYSEVHRELMKRRDEQKDLETQQAKLELSEDLMLSID